MSDFYGDNINRFWFGVVRIDNDHLHLGRVKVRIAGIHGNEIGDGDLPWAQIVLPTTEPGVDGLGQNPMLKTGAQVFGVFLDGKDSQLPLVLGSVPRLASPPPSRISSSAGDTVAIRQEQSLTTEGFAIDRNIPGSSNQEKCFLFFLDKGLTAKQSAGIVGNLMIEAGGSERSWSNDYTIPPWAFTGIGGNLGARGIAQWRGERAENLMRLAANTGEKAIPTPASYRPEGLSTYYPLEFQLGFIMWEFTNYSMGRRTYSALQKTQTVEEAAQVWWSKYEVNFDKISERLNCARNVYNNYGGI
jgi:hypothetical protein